MCLFSASPIYILPWPLYNAYKVNLQLWGGHVLYEALNLFVSEEKMCILSIFFTKLLRGTKLYWIFSPFFKSKNES